MLGRLLRQSGIYALANVAAKASGLVLLVFYGDPEVLPQAEFGYLGLLDAVKMFALLLAGVGIPLGIIRFSSSPSLSDEQRAAVPMTALVLTTVAGAVVAGLGWTGASVVAETLFGEVALAEPVRWLAVYVGFKTVSDVSYTVLRQRERAGAFVLIGVAEMALMVAAVLWFLVVRDEGLVGVMRGYALSAAVVAVVVTPVLLRHVERRVRWDLLRPMLAFGAPLIVSGLAGRFLNLGDRFLVVYFLGPEANAVYEWAARLGGVVNSILVQSFGLAFVVLGLKSLDATGDPSLHRQAFRHFSALAGWVVLGLGLFASDASRLITDVPAYIESDGLVILVAGGFGFYGLYFVAVNVLFADERTQTVAVSVGASALLNLALNAVLIPVIGLAGAAVATLLAYAALAVGTAWAGQRSTPVAYPWRALLLVCGLVGGLWGIAQPTAGWPLDARLAARVVLAAVYPAALFALGVYRRSDLERGLAMLRTRGREHDGSTVPPEREGRPNETR